MVSENIFHSLRPKSLTAKHSAQNGTGFSWEILHAMQTFLALFRGGLKWLIGVEVGMLDDEIAMDAYGRR